MRHRTAFFIFPDQHNPTGYCGAHQMVRTTRATFLLSDRMVYLPPEDYMEAIMTTVSPSPLDQLPAPDAIVQRLEDIEIEGKHLRQLLRLIRDREIIAKEQARRASPAAKEKEAERVAS